MTHGLRRFDGKVAIVIGGATGIGAATAVRLASEGAKVVVADLNGEAAEATAQGIVDQGGTAKAIKCDIGEEADVKRAFAYAEELWGGLDAVHINAADIAIARKDADAVAVSLEVFDRTIDINLRGHLLCTREAIPALTRRGGGAIIYTSSRGGLTSETTRVSYAMSKSGLHALMRHVALTWGREGIRANVIAPGTVLTEGMRLSAGEEHIKARIAATPNIRLGEPEDIAAGVAYLLSSDAGFVNGQILSVDGGATMR